MPMPDGDKRAVDILFRTFWSSEGWRQPPSTPPDDLAYAKAAGLMFDDVITATHDEIVAEVVDLAAATMVEDVANGFLSSLTTRRLARRSALGSYAVARHLAGHELELWYADNEGIKQRCGVCGLWSIERALDPNILNFERYKWGGVRRDNLAYVWFDLQQFLKSDERPAPTTDDISLFRELVAQLEDQPADVSAPKAQAALGALPSNKAERETVLDILGVCGVLETPEHRGYLDRFIPARERELPPLRFVERTYPVCWWNGRHGVNRRALAAFKLPT
jgi:hypothetical protein